MDPRLAPLMDLAFDHAKAADANAAISRVRDEQGDDFGQATSYELLLPPRGEVEHLTAKVLPKLVYFLECRGSKLPHCGGVFVSLFVGDELHFLHAADVVAELSRLSGLSMEELVKRYGSSTGA